ncbi:MAG TPA: hypothetical protein PKE29_11975 [Phycisphaerales bacterium]|nr:hypothetical protein [Phycisphaerales bacterium]
MIARVVAWYARRIVNVNINIALAGVLALVPVLAVVKLAEHIMATRKFRNGALQETLETHHHFIISGVTFVSDIVFDVAIYFALHWLANHAPRRAMLLRVEQRMGEVADAAVESVPFFKDAAKVQLQRAVLSPLLYLLWLGVQFFCMNALEFSVVWATVIGFCIAIGTVRTIHTFWMLREERKLRAIACGVLCGKCGYALRGIDAGMCPECGKPFARPGRADPSGGRGPASNGRPVKENRSHSAPM